MDDGITCTKAFGMHPVRQDLEDVSKSAGRSVLDDCMQLCFEHYVTDRRQARSENFYHHIRECSRP
jgi:hypothetical protein